MKVIKKMIQGAILAGILLMVQNVQAQRGQHHRGEQMLEKMKTELNLTAEQETQITAIQEKYQPQIEALKTQEFEDRSEKRAAFGELMKAQKTEVNQVLTEEQQAIMKEKRGHHKPHHRRHKGKNKAMEQEMKAYKEANIHPVLLKQRAKLEQDISPEDKATIAELRIAFNEMKAEREAGRKSFSKDKKGDDKDGNREEMKAKREALKAKYQPQSETLKALQEKYDTQIEALHQEIKPQQEQWKKDMHEIHKKHAAQDKNVEENAPSKDKKGHRKGHGKKHHKGKMGHHKMGKKHFLLLDPNEAPAPASAATQALTTLKAFPNPAINNNTLTYEVTEATRIKIALTDESGNVIKVLVNEFKEVGEYRMDVDLSNLKNGAYYYTVTDNGGISTQKVIVNSKQ